MRKLNSRRLRNTALRAIEDLQWIAEHATRIADRANADLDEALKARNYDGDGRGGATSTSVEAHVERRLHDNDTIDPDRIARQITELAGTVRLAADSADAARSISGDLTTSVTSDDRQAQSTVAKPAGGRGLCDNCGRWCSGDRNDRLITPVTSDTNRIGAVAQCGACLKYWRRHGELRPPKLWSSDEGNSAA